MGEKVAIVLFNLGGPDGPEDVQPFLKNLFRDKAIIRSPLPIRWFLARLISATRAKSARANYAKMGGGSPLLSETRRQADVLEVALAGRGVQAKCFIAMRYWHPFAKETVREVESWGADKVILLPLYPQFSTTTTGSSLEDWADAGGRSDGAICCYPTQDKLIEAHAQKLLELWNSAGVPENVRLLLSAHGLPEQVIEAGDPYQWQVEQCAEKLRPLLPQEWDVQVCYQSRVGPLKWIGPPTEESIKQAAVDGKSIMVSPIAFVSEHIETLVELDDEYKIVGDENGAKTYLRAPALGVTEVFVSGLADLVVDALGDPGDGSPRSHCGGRICPVEWTECPNRRAMVGV